MNILNVFLIYSMILLSTIILSVSTLKCYQCNSNDDPKCIALEDHPAHESAVFYKDCVGDFKGKDPLCRKIDVLIVDGKVRRVERTCGYERSKLPCYKADNDYHFETVCQCFTDGCNGSTKLPIFTLSFIIILGYINYLLV